MVSSVFGQALSQYGLSSGIRTKNHSDETRNRTKLARLCLVRYGLRVNRRSEVRFDPKEDFYNAKVLTEWSSERVDEWFDMLTDEAAIK